LSLLKLAEELAPVANPNVISDVAVAASHIRAALEGAIINIEINQQLIKNVAVKQQLQQIIQQGTEASRQTDPITKVVRERIKAL